MPRFIADFHIHSRYSRATSRDLTVQELAKWAKLKGITVLGTGDCTHPLWGEELKAALRPDGTGLLACDGVKFLLTVELNTLFYKAGRAHQIHQIVFVPGFEVMDRVNRELEAFGSLAVDGRPTLRLEPWRLVEVVRGIDKRSLIVPAHAWTPHFSIFGSNSGFDLVEACFEHQAQHIHALETGLSSDPPMNWRLSRLDRYALISNSDSHSARRIGREANVFDCDVTYDAMIGALVRNDPKAFVGTLEFFPEEGKYHYDGHRACGTRLSPQETAQRGSLCPRCGRKVTVGVMSRVEALADRPAGAPPATPRPFWRTVPLEEIIAGALGVGTGTQAVEREYQNLLYKAGTELQVLLETDEETLRRSTQPKIAEGVLRVRKGQVQIEPGYDGEYGKVTIFGEAEPVSAGEEQLTLF